MQYVKRERAVNFILTVDDDGKETRPPGGILHLLLNSTVLPNHHNAGQQVQILQATLHHVRIVSVSTEIREIKY